MRYKATIRAEFEVEFDDNGADSLVDQAHEAGEDVIGNIHKEIEISVVGQPEEA